MPIIVADTNITGIEQALALHDAEARFYADPDTVKPLLRGAECLLCRSTVKVNESLLGGTGVRFVATATAGADHFDEEYLRARGIAAHSAPGSNARSVAEYVFAALFHFEEQKGISFKDKTIGIIGVGHVGSEVERIASGLGMNVLLCDPPLKDKTSSGRYIAFDEVLRRSDIVTLHVPLTAIGVYPTDTMMNGAAFDLLTPGAVFINASRGGVVDESALKHAIASHRLAGVVLDVFRGEPRFDPETALAADIATPHIAGHSHDAKMQGTQMVYDALCGYLGWMPDWHCSRHLPPGETVAIASVHPGRERFILQSVMRHVYDITFDHHAMLNIAKERDGLRGNAFKEFRSGYRIRRECGAFTVRLTGAEKAFVPELQALGFKTEYT